MNPAQVSLRHPRITLDGRRPRRLDRRGPILRVDAGYVDLFAMPADAGGGTGARRHLFRVEADGIIPPLPAGDGESDLVVIAVGGPGTEASAIPLAAWQDRAAVETWIIRVAQVIAGPNPAWDLREAETGLADLEPGVRRRGPARAVTWVGVEAGAARLAGCGPEHGAGGPPIPLVAGLWIEAGRAGCRMRTWVPEGAALWDALDAFHVHALGRLHDEVASRPAEEARRLAARDEQNAGQARALFGRLAAIIAPRREPDRPAPDGDALLAACAAAAASIQSSVVRPPGGGAARPSAARDFDDVVDIARASRLRVRRVLLRDMWWTRDSGPLVAWHGEAFEPVALVRSGRRYVMTGAGAPRTVDRTLAARIAPEAAAFYPTLPGRALSLRDLAAFALRHARGNVGRIAAAAGLLGILSLAPPLVTQALVDSAIPRSELDQVAFCALALAVSALATGCVQLMESLAMLRLEGMVDWRLQAAIIDRLLRLPASVFRAYTVGDFVDRVMGVNAVRRIFTGRTLRNLLSGSFVGFSIGLMLFYDLTLALVAVGLALARAAMILAMSSVRLYHESRHFDLQGRVSGFVLQLLAGIGKLRVADATVRALAVWSRQFAAQRRHLVASQRASNWLTVFETSFPTLATLVVFATASLTGSSLTQNLGAFLAFFAAFGQTMGAIGSWASGVTGALVAIPHVTRLRPLVATAAEVGDDRKPPGELSGGIEVSRLTFRYAPGGPPILDNVSLRIAPGDYVAIVGPSGSGKSSLFRLLLGFETPEAGAVFYDGKALDTLDIGAVRRQFGVVLQNGRLSTGSLYDNICGGVQLPLEQAWEAARLAGLEPDIRALPMGMHTVVAEGVNTLSGGQRQRLMIARAIARRPRILLFDEATSSLDNRSQATVSATLGALNVTRIAIAHRLSTVQEADRIVVLVDGKVVQTGTFETLNAAGGTFSNLARRQLL